jgi:hypothetical protein
MRTLRTRAGSFAAVAMLMAACSVISSADAPPVPFPECEDEAFAFAGRTTLAALGLAEHWPEEAQVPADIWITANPPDPADWPAPPPEAPMPPGQRGINGRHLLCVQFDDGSGMVGPIEEPWEPRGAFDLDAGGEAMVPLGGVIVMVAALVVVGVSVLAFSGGPRNGAAG